MSQPPTEPPWGQWTDPRALIAGLDRLSERFADQARQVQEAMGESQGEITEDGIAVRVEAGRLATLRVLPELEGTSPVQARDKVLSAWREALVVANRSGAAALGAVADLPGGEQVVAGYRSSLPAEAQPAAESYDREHPTAPAAGGTAPSTGDDAPAFSRDALAELLGEAADDDTTASLEELVRELDFAAHRVPGDPATWQADLEADIARLSAAAAELPALMDQVTGEAETPLVRITVNAAGGLRDVLFRGRALSRLDDLNDDLGTVVGQAHREAQSALQQALTQRGWDPADDDPTMDLLAAPPEPDDPGPSGVRR